MKHEFFKHHMPYGLQKRQDGQWVVFNSFHAPLGFPEKETGREKSPVLAAGEPLASATYSLSEKAILKVVGETNVKRNTGGQIEIFYLFDKDALPPKTGKSWQHYLTKLLAISKLSAS